FGTAEVNAFYSEFADFSVLGTGGRVQLYIRALAEVARFDKGIGGFLDRGGVGATQSDGAIFGIDVGLGVRNLVDRFLDARDALFAAKVNAGDFGGAVGRRGDGESQGRDERKNG